MLPLWALCGHCPLEPRRHVLPCLHARSALRRLGALTLGGHVSPPPTPQVRQRDPVEVIQGIYAGRSGTVAHVVNAREGGFAFITCRDIAANAGLICVRAGHLRKKGGLTAPVPAANMAGLTPNAYSAGGKAMGGMVLGWHALGWLPACRFACLLACLRKGIGAFVCPFVRFCKPVVWARGVAIV